MSLRNVKSPGSENYVYKFVFPVQPALFSTVAANQLHVAVERAPSVGSLKGYVLQV